MPPTTSSSKTTSTMSAPVYMPPTTSSSKTTSTMSAPVYMPPTTSSTKSSTSSTSSKPTTTSTPSHIHDEHKHEILHHLNHEHELKASHHLQDLDYSNNLAAVLDPYYLEYEHEHEHEIIHHLKHKHKHEVIHHFEQHCIHNSTMGIQLIQHHLVRCTNNIEQRACGLHYPGSYGFWLQLLID
ncbi:hypothetical protein LTR91_008921 [Friedmanniomyces endolithicus]|uniref:Uncharacterized protein n=1 Tax=Friedmanniomyces endolithicus TaxID=329885 RepID=A0AAN6KLG9_9PEZI|nr:hypothetical protein LTR91_008921 [Friedmanniomyces endolithicus]